MAAGLATLGAQAGQRPGEVRLADPGLAVDQDLRWELIASPEVFIAAAAERTRHIMLGSGVTSLPYHHPFLVAQRFVQLDHMTRGRAMLGIGPGIEQNTHKIAECVDVREVRHAIAFLARFPSVFAGRA
mgnify:CR=1 FL=1